MTLAVRIAARYKGRDLVSRVASRHVEAFEFSSEKERSRYLKEHPDADPGRHTVKKPLKPKGAPQPPPKPTQPGKGQVPSGSPTKKTPPPLPAQGKPTRPIQPPSKKAPAPEAQDTRSTGRKVVDTLKGLSSGAANMLKKAPVAVQKFFQDDSHRRAVLMNLHGAIGAAPGKLAKSMIETAKSEGHEFKTASEGVRAVMAGGKLSKHQKKAIKQVSIHMGIVALASVLTTTGIGAGLAFAGKALVTNLSLKSVHRVFGHLHTASEVSHIGHGVLELMSKFSSTKVAGDESTRDPGEVLAAIVLKSIQEELANLKEEDLRTILESMAKQNGPSDETEEEEEPSEEEETEETSEEDEEEDEPDEEEDDESEPGMLKEASALMTGPEVANLCEEAQTVHKGLRVWIREFPKVLRKAEEGAVLLEDSGLVWQDEFGPYWKGLDHPMDVLASIDEKLEDIQARSPQKILRDVASFVRKATNDRLLPQKARLEYAFGNPQFRDHPDRRSHIAYEIQRVEDWARTFEDWVEGSIFTLSQGARKARRLV